MKQIVLFWGLMCCFCAAKAQTFFIPDSNFFNAILDSNAAHITTNSNSGAVVAISCSTCVVNYATREMDSACIDGLNITLLVIDNRQITNLQGITSFVDLTRLSCNNNQLTILPTLPTTLSSLSCFDNQLTILPTLPNSLHDLTCYNNQLISLPALPNSFQTLWCGGNQLTILPALPNSLQFLHCKGNQLTSLPTLPNSLQQLHCSNNPLTILPTLPNSLQQLDCSNNQLTILPTLSNSLTHLYCSQNQLISLPTLPNNLYVLGCDQNQLTSLPTLPNNLYGLGCDQNQLTSLPILPNNLYGLGCSQNQLTSLPTLPNSLTELYCDQNQLTSLPILPNSLTDFYCNQNQLTSLPTLPNSLYVLDCGNNPLFCCPNIPNNIGLLNYTGTYITCLPNHTANINSLPLCDQTNTPTSCMGLATTGMSEFFPLTEIRQIIHDTLYLPFTSPAIDIIDYEIAVYNKTPTQKDTLVIFGCDVVLGKPQQVNTLYGISSPITTWQGKIPYNPVGITDSIRKAIQYFNVRAAAMGIRIAFVPKQPTDTDFVTFRHSPGSFASYVGKIGGEQYIWADTAGFTGKILHEMTHTLGMYHEHQRDSAQFYVNIQGQYISPAFADAFCRIKDIQTTPYDFNSIMHYVCFAFSKFPPIDGLSVGFAHNTILPTQAMNDAEMGQRSDYTDYDIADINQLYPYGIVGGIGFTGTGIFRLLIDTTNIASIAWSVYNTEPLVFAGNTYNIAVTATNVNGSMTKAAITAPFPAGAPRAARGFVIATVTFANGQQKKFYKYVYRN